MKEVWYKASIYAWYRGSYVTREEFDRSTASCLFRGGRKVMKFGDNESYFLTPEAAKDWLVDRQRRIVESAEASAEERKARIDSGIAEKKRELAKYEAIVIDAKPTDTEEGK